MELQLQQPSSQRIFSGLFPLGLTGLISLLSKGHSRVFSGTTIQNINSSALNSFLMVQFSHLDLSTGATIALTIQKFVSKVTALHFNMLSRFVMGFPGGSDGKDSTCHAGEADLIPGLERSPGERNGNPLQYSRLENSMDRGAWWAIAYGVTKSPKEMDTTEFLLYNNANQPCVYICPHSLEPPTVSPVLPPL